eukprot:CAMPEP_0113540854 /NCGR_PEP_ID=MMETSP0015_2-20120614/8706_1 /TAXON_ID=2838 /ORGANISM="Odontella" /LENGTH=344 /DNA_ID=CAMNT_0000440693 /DNA_START=211 /DNA_END=1245 /DNA_ORIENTATION=+ /assembly_acc=CAM_ASM_000160
MISRSAVACLILAAAGAASAFTAPSAFARSSSSSSRTFLSASSSSTESFDPLGLAAEFDFDYDFDFDFDFDYDFASSEQQQQQQQHHQHQQQQQQQQQQEQLSQVAVAKALAAASVAWGASSSVASAAAGPDWGIFEGRTGSLLHPVTMGCMFLLSLSTGFLGLQWRRQRELGDEIGALRKTLPDFGEFRSAGAALEAAKAAEGGEEEVDASAVAAYQKALPVEKQIAELADERKELSSKGLRDKHYNQGALLAFLGTAFAIEGPLNTYARAGKLFPGPHLYAGAGCVVLWSLAAACVPFMSKGNDTARSIHIAANAVGTGLFGWQVLTGWPILLKVVELTKWP